MEPPVPPAAQLSTVVLPLLTSVDLAQQLGISVRQVRRLVADRRIPFTKFGRLVRFEPAVIEHWVEEQRVMQHRSSRRAG